MKRRKKAPGAAGHRQPGGARPGTFRGFGLVLILLGCVLASGLQVVITTHELRATHRLFQEARNQQDLLLAEHSRLLLERGALVAYQNIERVAVAELGMRFPDQVERIVP